MRKNIILIGNTPPNTVERHFTIIRGELIRPLQYGAIGGELIKSLRYGAFVHGGIDNRAVMKFYVEGRQIAEVSDTRPDLGVRTPILLSYVDGGIRNTSTLEVELYEGDPRKFYDVQLDDLLVFGVGGGIDKAISAKLRIVVPKVSDNEGLTARLNELYEQRDQISHEFLDGQKRLTAVMAEIEKHQQSIFSENPFLKGLMGTG